MSKKRINYKSPLVILVFLIVFAAVLLLAYRSFWSQNNSVEDDGNPTTSTSVNLGSPSDEEKREAEEHKKQLAEQEEGTPPSSSQKKQVTPVITTADTERVTAYVPGIFEEGGTCTATFTRGSQAVTKTSEGFGNASYTSCSPINPGDQVSGEGWMVTVSYSSKTAEGKSQPKQVEVK